jgi:hypothetical protein
MKDPSIEIKNSFIGRSDAQSEKSIKVSPFHVHHHILRKKTQNNASASQDSAISLSAARVNRYLDKRHFMSKI